MQYREINPTSSAIKRLAYTTPDHNLYVWLKSAPRDVRRYHDVPAEVWFALSDATDIDAAFAATVRDCYDFDVLPSF